MFAIHYNLKMSLIQKSKRADKVGSSNAAIVRMETHNDSMGKEELPDLNIDRDLSLSPQLDIDHIDIENNTPDDNNLIIPKMPPITI